jgi:AraC-like DNA-binding protein
MHAHHYVQYGFSNSPVFKLYSPELPNTKQVRSFFIPSDVPHRLNLSGEDTVLMVWLDPEYHTKQTSHSSSQIKYPLPDLETSLNDFYNCSLNCETAGKIRNIITGKTSSDIQQRDDRIVTALSWITGHLDNETITVDQIAKVVYLSPGRFMHLFSEQTGIPVRKYILWQRLKCALLQIADEHTITEAAHSAGFTDSSHMNRTFNAMFGITPSKIFKNSRFIQVIAC